jgi:hypothetical protein
VLAEALASCVEGAAQQEDEQARASTSSGPLHGASAAAAVPGLISRRCQELLRAMRAPLLHDVAVMLESAQAAASAAAAAATAGVHEDLNEGGGHGSANADAGAWAMALLWYCSRVAAACGPEGAALAGLPAHTQLVPNSDVGFSGEAPLGSSGNQRLGGSDGAAAAATAVHAAQPLLAELLRACALRAPLTAKQALAVRYRCYKKMVLMDGVLLTGG